jgi:galactokinase
MNLTYAAIAGFEAAYGRLPDVAWSAPGRVNLIGEHTDYNDGLVLPFAIAERTVVAAGRAGASGAVIAAASAGYPDVARRRLKDIGPGAIPGWAAYPLGVAWALQRHANGPVSASLYISSAVPEGAGLSSSAALEMGVASALDDLWALGLSPAELARAGQLAENEVVGAPTGIMDQYASLLGVADAAVFLDCRTQEAGTVPLRLRRAGLELVLIDTGERHAHAAGGYAARRAACEKAAHALGVPALRDLTPDDLPRMACVLDGETFRRARHVITENERVTQAVAALEAGDAPGVGRLLTASHASMRDDFEITTPALDLAVEAALRGGALGARMTGGGFGGAVIALVAADRVPSLAEAVTGAFRAARHRAPHVRPVVPSGGARKEA